METVEALLEDEVYEGDLTKHDDTASNAQVLDCDVIGTHLARLSSCGLWDRGMWKRSRC